MTKPKGKVNHKAIQDRLFKRIHRTGEEIKNDFPNILRAAIDNKSWEHFSKADGTSFKSLGDWLVYSFPNGLSMGNGSSVISYEDALQLVADRRDLHGLLVKHRPKGTAGRPKESVNNVNELNPKRPQGNSRACIEARLQKDFPKIYKRYVNGEIKSARQAGIQAGFVVDGHDPLKRLKSNWKKATTKDRAEFRKWLRTAEAK